MEKEIWKPIEGFVGYYEISNQGRVKRLPRVIRQRNGVQHIGEYITFGKEHNGYKAMSLSVGGKQTALLVHRMVALAFIPNPNNYPMINHKDGIRNNNNVENLEWCTMAMNGQHAHDTGLNKSRKGVPNPNHGALHDKSMKINQYDREGNLIQTFSSQGEAARYLKIRQSAISSCLKNKGGVPRKYFFKKHDTEK